MNYTYLTQEEKYQIYALLRAGFSKHYIAWKSSVQFPLFLGKSYLNRQGIGILQNIPINLSKDGIGQIQKISLEIWEWVISCLGLQ